MKRKDFIKGSLLAGASVAFTSGLSSSTLKPGHQHQQVGFNHLPNKNEGSMNSVLHRANTRGHANHGWLDSHHSFSFANYYNPDRMHFGALRVLNDDQVAPGMGFGTHPHQDMEIISIPLEGDLEHKDSMGNSGVIRSGDIQVMSAGTGIQHSEFNANKNKEVKFLQIWIFPRKNGVEPRYDQITLNGQVKENDWTQILSPNPDDEGVWIHQDAWMHLGHFKTNKNSTYTLKNKNNGVYFFVLEGSASVASTQLNARDGMGLWDVEELSVEASAGSRVLTIEVPMKW